MLHGNLRLSLLDHDFVESGDYAQIRTTAGVLQGLLGPGRAGQARRRRRPR